MLRLWRDKELATMILVGGSIDIWTSAFAKFKFKFSVFDFNFKLQL